MFRHTLVAVVGAAALGLGSTAFAQGEHEVVAPVVAHHVDAVYPPSALAERKHADVVLTVTIDVDGHVSKVDVIESGGPDLDERRPRWRPREWTAFVPAMRDGKPGGEPHQDARSLRAAGLAPRARRDPGRSGRRARCTTVFRAAPSRHLLRRRPHPAAQTASRRRST